MLPQSQDPLIMQELARRAEIENQIRRIRGSASNFYWIAGLSVVNSVIRIFDGSLTFVIGLGITQLTDAVAYLLAQSMPEIALPLRIVGLGVSGVIAAIFFLFGLFASKLQRWAFIVGIVLYSLDAILVLIFQDWFGFIFHLVMLWGAVRGMLALNKLNQSFPRVASNSSFPASSSS